MPTSLPTLTPQTEPREETRTRRIPPYNVILLNDDDHTREFVVDVLQKVLGCKKERACQLMMEADTTGRSVIWTGTQEGAELKQEQVGTFHEKHWKDGRDLGPLGCDIEPAPGG